MHNPILTVLMPVYNSERFLAEAIDSILQQTFPHFEFLIIDDGSTDSSADIVRSYRDDRIRFIQNEKNMGISATLNKGIEMASTELIARMDADDISYPVRLQKQYEYFIAHPDCGLLSTAARIITEDKKPLVIDEFKSAFFYYNLTFECWIYHPTVMYNRQAVIDVGKYATPYSEDYDLWWRISRKYKIDNLPKVLVDYRISKQSLCRVTKKTEYETAQYDQVLRNIHYYVNGALQLTYSEIECLRNNFGPIIKENSLNTLINCIKKLDYINHCILNKENINRDEATIGEAAKDKKEFIMANFRKNLPKMKAVLFYIRIGYWKQLYNILVNKLPRIIRPFFSK